MPAGRRAAVNLLTNPRVRGYDQAVNAVRNELIARYHFMDLWLFFPDADRATEEAMRELEASVGKRGANLLCCIAQPELEIFACAGFRDDIRETWEEARRHPRLKEEVFEPLLRRHGDPRQPGAGRGLMINASVRNLPLLFDLCPELRCLHDRIAEHLQEG